MVMGLLGGSKGVTISINVPAVATVQGDKIMIKINKRWLEGFILRTWGLQYIDKILEIMGCEPTENPEFLACELARVKGAGKVEVNLVTYIFALKYMEEITKWFKITL